MSRSDAVFAVSPDTAGAPVGKSDVAYATANGQMVNARIEDALNTPTLKAIKGKVALVFTSPPFPLLRKKKYGNKLGLEYLEWLSSLAPQLADLLAPDGSIVVELGNCWEPGSPVMSTLPLEALIKFKDAAKLNLCQQVICHNPARLPSPIQWVNIDRCRLKDSYTNVWWMSRNERPKADNRRVLTPYGERMKALLKRKSYNSGARPSGHVISEKGFLTDHGGAIAASVIDVENPERMPTDLLQFSGTGWDRQYRTYCKNRKIPVHPARMQAELAAFFIQFLTEPGDLVVDPFAGSNTTGFAAETLGRRWLSIEAEADYVDGSRGRFAQI